MTKKDYIKECERQNAIRREQQFGASTIAPLTTTTTTKGQTK